MGFSYIENIYWIILLPLMVFFTLVIYRRVKNITNAWFSGYYIQFNVPLLKTGLRALALLCLFIALLGPYWGRSDQSVNEMGREIYILLDLSASMNVDDMKPTRLDKVKKELNILLESLKGDHIGIITFASHAYVQCPITRDQKAVKMFLDLAETSQFAQTGTDLRGALYMALERFSNAEKRSDRVSRAIVLVTDGEDFGEGYISILDRLAKNNIKVFPVGIGTTDGAAVPELSNGKIRGHKHRQDGSIVISSLKDEGLQAIADKFDTPYIRLDNPAKNLKQLDEYIRTLSASSLATRTGKVENSKYYIFVGLALLCWIATLFIMPMEKK